MYFRQPLLLICIFLILTERVHSQSPKGPGISSCNFADFRDSECMFPPLTVSELPPECTSLIYNAAIIDENYCIGPAETGADYAILDDLLKSGKDIYLYYGRMTSPDWCTMLENANTNALREMESIKGFFKDHQGIAGLILCGISYDEYDPKCPKFTENFKIYLDVLQKTFPNLAIGLDLFGCNLIDQYNYPIRVWLDFKVLDVSVDFYAVTMEVFNPCSPEFNTGIVIKSGNFTDYTLDKLADVLQKMSIPKAKTYFKFNTCPDENTDILTDCDLTNEAFCEMQPFNISTDWCSDTIATYNEKGEFSKEYGAGFMTRYINLEDNNNTCQCERPFFAFYALLDGFNGTTSKPCELFDNRNY
ncbi:hypothetical protein AGLY_008666 [Aphis glycines]|uniref:GH18 domain-containing protein n=1 Tax=Aphis glycines TaxID=307491 RepID=A0A6G0TLX6_APHGL|nr:hypothetical protein AGLY_008666 [Aphis glycines]